MSEEEKKAIEYLEKEYSKPLKENEDETSTCFLINLAEARKILNFIYKQQKEIEELKFDLNICDKDLNCLNEKIYQLKQDKKKLILGKFREVADKNEYIKSEYVSKDKIRNLLKQVNTSLYHFKDSDKNNIMQRIKDRLEELLEE